jgi:23S rRNA-/tRNA-specific pseudouridylate synthase
MPDPPVCLLREVSAEGKPSQTTFTVLEKYDGYSHLRLQPLTGRTHQLRVHCAYSGFPILGDPQYGSEASKTFSENLGLNTQQLCAYCLEFPHPITGVPVDITSGFPIAF